MERFDYIDRLKGVAILCVVVSHVSLFCVFGRMNAINTFLDRFQMPLFFFLSGFVVSQTPDIKKCMVKLGRFMMPFLCIGLLYTYVSEHDLYFFINDKYKSGYWYFYVLTVFYFLLLLFRIAPQSSTRKSLFINVILALSFWALLNVCNNLIPQELNNRLCMEGVSRYWFYFSTAFIIRKFDLLRYLVKDWIYTLSVLGFVGGSYFYLKGDVHLARPVSLFAVVFFLIFFEARAAKNTMADRMLAFLGRGSLDVYTLHYFLLLMSSLTSVGVYLDGSRHLVVAAIFCLVIALGLSYISIYIGKLFHRSKIIENIIYGKYFEYFYLLRSFSTHKQ